VAKIQRPPEPFLYPLPVALVTCTEPGGGSNILTVSWVMNACAAPPMLTISLRPHRYSTQVIQETGEFAVNIPSYNIAYEVDLCGTLSGRDADKLRISGLTEAPASVIKAPLLEECVVSMECITRQSIPLGSHTLFLAEIAALHVDEVVYQARGSMEDSFASEEDLAAGVELDKGDDELTLELTRAKPLLYAPHTHEYWVLGDIAQCHLQSSGKKP